MAAKKSILIVNNNMLIGGIQKSLSNLLKEIYGDYDITLLLFKKEGALLAELPKEVKVEEANKFIQIMGMSQERAKAEGRGQYLLRAACALFTRLFSIRAPYFLLTHTQRLKQRYDYAVSYMQNPPRGVFYGGCNEFVLNSVNADVKVGFIHCDYMSYGGNNPYNIKVCSRFDAVAACSDGCRKSFVTAAPELAGRTFTVHNCNDIEKTLELSREYEVDYSSESINLLTVARLSEEKGVMRIPKILKSIREDGLGCVWHIVGDGPLRTALCGELQRLGVEKLAVIHGEAANPYPHYAAADVFVLPSYNEAAPMVFGEAEICGLPVIATNTISAKELVADKNIGWVCENSTEAVAAEIKRILRAPELLKNKSDEMKKLKTDNSAAVSEFKALFK